MSQPSVRVLHPNDVFALKYVHDARLSPDGRHAAFVVSRTVEATGEEFFEITIEELASGARREVPFAGRATSPRWSPDGKRLAFVGTAGRSSRLYVSDADAHDVIPLTPDDRSVLGPPSWSPDGTTVAYVVMTQHDSPTGVRRLTKRIFRSEGIGIVSHMEFRLQLANVKQGGIRQLELSLNTAMQPAFSPDGRSLLFLGSDSAIGYPSLGGLNLFTVDLDDGKVVEVLGERWFVAAAAWSPCGKRIVVAGDYDSKMTVPMAHVWVVNRDGSKPQCRTEGLRGNVGLRIHHDMPTWETSQNNILCVPDTAYACVTLLKSGCAEICRVALDGPTRYESVASGPRTCVIMDASSSTSQLLYCASDLNTPWELYWSDLEGREEKRLTRLNEAVLSRWPRLQVEHLTFQSNDGMPLEAWHLMRADRSGPQPTVMFIHGGPMLSIGHIFRFDFHLLAANGYAVLFANFRGSSGYGQPFMQAILGDWGARGFPDHMATIDCALERGLADPNRLGVWGPSHGGFATAWAVGHTDRFRAAVAEAAPTNFSTLYYLADAPDIFVRDLGGRPDEIPDIYRSRSPLTYVGRCRTPTLLLHGEDDLRCPVAEAEQFYRALHDVGCTTELVRISGMAHMGDSIGPLPARLGQNEALLDWFERYL